MSFGGIVKIIIARFLMVYGSYFSRPEGFGLSMREKAIQASFISNYFVTHDIPDYIKLDGTEKLEDVMQGKKTHKHAIVWNLLIIDLVCNTGLRCSHLANLTTKDMVLKEVV